MLSRLKGLSSLFPSVTLSPCFFLSSRFPAGLQAQAQALGAPLQDNSTRRCNSPANSLRVSNCTFVPVKQVNFERTCCNCALAAFVRICTFALVKQVNGEVNCVPAATALLQLAPPNSNLKGTPRVSRRAA